MKYIIIIVLLLPVAVFAEPVEVSNLADITTDLIKIENILYSLFFWLKLISVGVCSISGYLLFMVVRLSFKKEIL